MAIMPQSMHKRKGIELAGGRIRNRLGERYNGIRSAAESTSSGSTTGLNTKTYMKHNIQAIWGSQKIDVPIGDEKSR